MMLLRVMRRLATLFLVTVPLFAQLPAGITRVPFPDGTPFDARQLVATSDGALWVSMGLEPVIMRLDPVAGWQRIELPESGIWDMTIGPDGAVWVATRKHAGRIDPVTNRLTRWNQYRSVRTVLTGPDGNLWFTQGVDERYRIWIPRLVRFSPAGVELANVQLPGTFGPVNGSDGALWFSGTQSGASRLIRLTPDGVRADYPIEKANVLFAGPGFFWTAFDDRVVRLNHQGAIIGAYRVAMTPVAVDPLGNLWLRSLTDGGEEIAQLTPGGVLTRFQSFAALPSTQCEPSLDPAHGGLSILPDGRVAMAQYSAKSGSEWDPCASVTYASDIVATLTILDPAIAPIASIEQLNPVPRRRIVRR